MLLAKDAASGGNRVLSESYLQHAEHYQRIINSWEGGVHASPASYQDRSATTATVEVSQKKEDDLSLPSSILGGFSKPESEILKERTEDFATV